MVAWVVDRKIGWAVLVGLLRGGAIWVGWGVVCSGWLGVGSGSCLEVAQRVSWGLFGRLFSGCTGSPPHPHPPPPPWPASASQSISLT